MSTIGSDRTLPDFHVIIIDVMYEISNLTKFLTHSPFFQPNLRGPLDSLASVFGLAHRRNLRWHLASSSGEHVCLLLMLLV